MTKGEQPGTVRAVATRGGGVVAVLAALIATYMISQFQRSAIGVLGPDLARELALDASRLGFLSSAFFLSFALAQIPVGIAIDRYGARNTLIVSAVIALAGTLLFAVAETGTGLIAARALIGLGCASFFMAPLAIYARRFPPERFAILTSLTLGAGTLGTLVATAPLAAVAAWIGWRGAFFGMAGLTALIIGAVMLSLPPRPRQAEARESWGEALKGVGEALQVRSFWPVFFLHATTYSAFACIVGLWAGPWLSDVQGADLQMRGNLILIAAAAQITGIFAWGAADRWFRSYRRQALTAGTICVGLLLIAGLVPLQGAALIAWLVFFGFAFGYVPIVTSHGKALFPDRLTGRGITLMNIATMGGVFVSQALTGLMVAQFAPDPGGGYPAQAYHAVFLALAAALALALAFYSRAIDPHPSRP
ncbi:MAG: MFS transporter [Salinarimonas sp.]|nr:MFS transporter [Salinarimonas sp.]